MYPFIDEILFEISKRKSINKRLKIMATLIMFTVVFNSFANNNLYSQTEISLNLKNTSIIGVLDYIESTTDLRFIFDSDIFNFKEKVSLNIKNKNLKQTLNGLFDGKVIYELKENLVFLKEIIKEDETPLLLEEEEVEEVQSPITGIIVDEDGVPLPGVNVFIKGTNIGTATDFDGNYSIAASEGDILIFSFVGFSNREFVVGDQNNIDISMESDYANLDEVVITGYGSTAKKDLVSSISQIKGEDLANQPVARLDNMLQGRAAGVNVVASSGEPGAPAVIRVRGMSSINGNNNPLYVIDGFIAGTDFNLTDLNVNDIESIEILKDASSLAIYGTRGAAGVIIVNTKTGKSGKEGKVNVSINHYTSFQQVYNYPEMASVNDWADYWNEAATLIPGVSGFGENDPTQATPIGDISGIPEVDWQDLITRDGRIDNTDINISGNTGKTNYFISYNRFNQEGIIEGSGLERNSIRLNFDTKVNDKLRAGVRLALTDRRQEVNKVNFNQVYFNILPIRQIFDSSGNYTAINPISGTTQRNPVSDINHRIRHRFVTNILANAYAEYDILPDLTLRTSVGTNLTFNKFNRYVPTVDPIRNLQGTGGKADVDHSRKTGVLNENTLTYSKEIGAHSFKILAGFTLQKDTFSDLGAGGQGYANDVVTFNNLALGAISTNNTVGSNYNQRTFESILGRINYSYNDKYLLTLVGRRDGSSVFEQGNKYAFFPSIGAAWKISEEDFMQQYEKISSLKLRASYGIVGEQGVSPYNSYATYIDKNVFFNDQASPAVFLNSLPSVGLEWEKTYQTDIGLEVGFDNNRYSIEIDYYNKQTKDLLLNRPLPGTAGESRLENVGEVENKGFEFTLNTLNIEKPDFLWSSSIQISSNKNKVVSLGGSDDIYPETFGWNTADASEGGGTPSNTPVSAQAGDGIALIPGQPMPTFMGAIYEGTYKSSEEIIADGREGLDLIGGPNFVDQNGDGAINQLDFVPLGSAQPDFIYGIRNTLSYKQWTLDVFIQGTQGNEIFDTSRYLYFFGRDSDSMILPELVDRWTPSNPNSDVPRAGTSAGGYPPLSNVNISDGSYIRLRNVTLNYDLDLPFADSASVYLTGNNLLLITDFKFGDPEGSDSGDSSSVLQGISDDQYPYASSVSVGLRLNF